MAIYIALGRYNQTKRERQSVIPISKGELSRFTRIISFTINIAEIETHINKKSPTCLAVSVIIGYFGVVKSLSPCNIKNKFQIYTNDGDRNSKTEVGASFVLD